MNPFQSDNIWKKKARQGKAQQHPLTPQQEWQKQVNSSSLWLGGGVVLLALYLAAVRAGTVALDASAVVLIVVIRFRPSGILGWYMNSKFKAFIDEKILKKPSLDVLEEYELMADKGGK